MRREVTRGERGRFQTRKAQKTVHMYRGTPAQRERKARRHLHLVPQDGRNGAPA